MELKCGDCHENFCQEFFLDSHQEYNFQLFTGKEEMLLIWWDTFLILNLSLDAINSVTGFNLKSGGLASQSLHKLRFILLMIYSNGSAKVRLV